MGDPKFQRKKYETPGHPWQRERLDIERELVKEYGIKNKRELWKMDAIRKRCADRVKVLIVDKTPQGEIEMKQLKDRMYSLGLIEDTGGDVDLLLSIQLKNVLERRLETIVFRKNLAHTIKQARQFIVHGHIFVGTKKMTSPSHIATRAEEAGIRYSADSPLSAPNHAEVTKEIKPKKAKPRRDSPQQRGRFRRK